MRRFELLSLICIQFIIQVDSLGCMVKICGQNQQNELRRCPDIDGSCGNYHTERSNGEIVDGVDVKCQPGEPIYAPFDGEMYFWRPFGGKTEKSCADQGVRIEGIGQWHGYAAHISSIKLSFYGGFVSAGQQIGEAIDRTCHLEPGQSNDIEPHVEVKLFKSGRLIDPTYHLQNCMCTGQICESNNRNVLNGEPFMTDKRYNGVRGWDIKCEKNDHDEEEQSTPIVYSPIDGEVVGRIRLYSDANGGYSGCDNDGVFITGSDKWIGFEARLYNVKVRNDIGFGRKRIIQGEPIAHRLDCAESPNSVFLEMRYEGRVVNLTDLITANKCKLPDLPAI